MSSSSNNAVPVPEEMAPAAAQERLAYGTTPRLYLSYGMLATKGMHPALTDGVEAAPSFTVMSPPTGLDLFAMLDGRDLGTAAADGESERLLALLRDAVARQVYLEVLSHSPRFRDKTNVFRWWATTLKEAFRAFHDEVAACRSLGEPAAVPAIVALVLEKYLVVGNCGASKAVLSRDGEVVELSSDSQRVSVVRSANRRYENKSVHGGRVAEATSKLATVRRSAGSSALAAVVDVVAVEREARDEFLILGSAALWDKLTPAAACAHVRRRLGRTSRVTMPWETRITDADDLPTLLAEEHAKKAVYAGAWDNVSVGLVVFRDFWAAGHAQADSKC